MSLSTKKEKTLSPSDILCNYLIKAQLSTNTFLEELQETYFAQILRKEFETGITIVETLEEIIDWELYGKRLIENISPDIEGEEYLEVQLNHEIFIGWLDRFGNGSGNLNVLFSLENVYVVLHDLIIIEMFKAFYKKFTRRMDCANFRQRDKF